MHRTKKRKASTRRGANARPKDSVISSPLAHINHNQHTGKRLPIHNTSYAALFFIITLTALLMFFARQQIANAVVQTQQGSVQLSGVVYGPPPGVAASIDLPANNSSTESAIVTISGDCTAGLIVEIYRNNIFAGSYFCGVSGTYALSITLIPGTNNLVARIRDASSQYGPDSDTVIVSYNPSNSVSGSGSTGTSATSTTSVNKTTGTQILPLLLSTNSVQPGVYSGDHLILKYHISGGVKPYAMSVNWGDNTKPSLQSLSNKGAYNIGHTYTKAGQYAMVLSATDSQQNQAVVQTVAVVNSSTKYDAAATITCSAQNSNSSACIIQNAILQNIDKIWPPLVGAGFMTFSFWLGERVVYARLSRTIIGR